jgi:hypothetical protein
MPYELIEVSKGKYKVCKVGESKCFSKKGLSKKKAEAQLKAIGIHERKKMKGGAEQMQAPTFDEYLKENYPDYANLSMQGTRQVGKNSWETVVNSNDKILFDKEKYDKFMADALGKEEFEKLKKKNPRRTQTYEEYIKSFETIARARSTRNLSAEERSSMDKQNMDNKVEIYNQYLKEYPEMQPTMCRVKDEKVVPQYQTTMGICKEEHRKYDKAQQCSGVFGKINCALTDVADWAVENIGDKLPGVGKFVSEAYKSGFAPPTSKFYTGSGIPKNRKLYEEIKKEIYEKQPKNSLYRSTRIVKEYKNRNGQFRESKSKEQMNIPKWFKQDWIDVQSYMEGKEKKCGSVKNDKYPLCRPKKILEKLTEEQMKKMLDEKQKLKEKPLITKKVLGTDKFNIKPTLSGTGSGKKDFKTYLKEVQKVSPIKYMNLVKKNAKENGYDTSKIKWATDGKHKLEYDGVKFGAMKYMDYLLYQLKEGKGMAEIKRKNYRKRAEKVMKASDDKFSPASLSYYILW